MLRNPWNSIEIWKVGVDSREYLLLNVLMFSFQNSASTYNLFKYFALFFLKLSFFFYIFKRFSTFAYLPFLASAFSSSFSRLFNLSFVAFPNIHQSFFLCYFFSTPFFPLSYHLRDRDLAWLFSSHL